MIGITADYHEKRHRVSSGYTNAIVSAGGIPIILPNIVDLVPHFMNLCDGFVFTGGDDPIMQEWGIETHHNAEPVHQSRQTFELTLLRHVQKHPEKSVLGVCLGMQWMGLIAGGTLNQDLAEPFASNHKKNDHIIAGAIGEGTVHSHHHQAMESVGELEVVATSDDGIIEAIQDSNRLWYKGVQWHPERTANKKLGQRLFDQMVLACKKT
ncbi:MAG: C26 family cysteine hydrolase domain-containing family [Phycisphaerae bacterium]|nr:C26 family cysteine hydrolase domain-containing family [Phycisphaerae bacterium]